MTPDQYSLAFYQYDPSARKPNPKIFKLFDMPVSSRSKIREVKKIIAERLDTTVDKLRLRGVFRVYI